MVKRFTFLREVMTFDFCVLCIGFAIGDSLTYVDLAILHALRSSESQFPDAWGANKDIPLLRAFKERMESRDRLAAYLKSDRARKFEGNSMM